MTGQEQFDSIKYWERFFQTLQFRILDEDYVKLLSVPSIDKYEDVLADVSNYAPVSMKFCRDPEGFKQMANYIIDNNAMMMSRCSPCFLIVLASVSIKNNILLTFFIKKSEDELAKNC